MNIPVAGACAAALLTAASIAPQNIGTVRFPNSGAAAAQESFLRGVALLHSYEYDDARAAFRQAETADPAFALAYWMDGLTYSRFDWGTEDLPKAQAALARLAPARDARLAKAGNDHERAFGAAVESFLDGHGTTIARARAFEAAMQAWSAASPGDVEAMAFAARSALYVLRYAPPAERVQRAEEAIALARRVVAAAPDHPGGQHYLIHATDSPRFATEGIEAARAYDKLAPDADHALHMPSHIYLQLGMWAEVSASNQRAWDASRARVARTTHSVADLGWHSLQWLQYGRLQEGRYKEARALIDTARQTLAGVPADALASYTDARYIVETMEFQYAAETGDWTHVTATLADVRSNAAQSAAAPSLREQQQALAAAYHAGAALAGRRDAAAGDAAGAIRAAFASAPSGDPQRASAEQMALQLDALAAVARGDSAAAIDRLTRLASPASAFAVTPAGPPTTRPPAELLGAALAGAGRNKEAVDAYVHALVDRPNRSAALLGLARARTAIGDKTAADTYAQLRSNWEHADADVPALAEVRQHAAK
jgi:hypothetical protein